MLKASIEDNDDCAKSFVCHANAKPARVSVMESFVYEYFGGNVKPQTYGTPQNFVTVDALSPSVQFDLAAQVGRVGGAKQCQEIYARCKVPYNELLAVLEGKMIAPAQQLE